MDTIAAIAGAVIDSGIGIIRISGDEAIQISDRIIRLKEKDKKLSDCPSHTIHYGFVVQDEKVLDEVMAVVLKAPRSYTREDTVEIDCHGGTEYVLRLVTFTTTPSVKFTSNASPSAASSTAAAHSTIASPILIALR